MAIESILSTTNRYNWVKDRSELVELIYSVLSKSYGFGEFDEMEKELLDSGIITQKEFDKKKKELLNL